MIRRALTLLGLAVVLLGVLAGIWAFVSITTDRPVTYESIEEHFKYGSIGSEPGGSLLAPVGGALPPYWVFKSLPSICSDKLPNGYATFGFISEPGRDLPIGVSRRRRLGIEQVGLNCAVCHTGTVRETPAAEPRIVLGMPANRLDLQGFVQFVLECSLDNRLTAEAIKGRLPKKGGPSLFERALLNFGLVERLKDTTLNLRNRIAPVLADTVPRWGRGRVDTFNPYKSVQFNWDLGKLPPGELIGASDFPSIWNQKPREGMHLHWDGDNDSVDERNLSAGLGAGITPVTVDHAGLKRVRDWIWTLPPPSYPYPVDGALASRGEALYRQHCESCHGDHRFRTGVKSGDRMGQVEDIDRIKTDRHRLDSYTETFALNQYGLFPDSRYRFTRFRKTHGYANQPLDGIWARAPYLHNGSVPTLRDLLNAPAERPAAFYRGYDVYDQARVGFVTTVAEEGGHRFSRYDTSVPGNGNMGHEYGTSLPGGDKDAIVEYLKTF
ncbi:MAG TPA: cytochrome c [Vicinamibacterales bacterium]|nr:cytochrome c [Vicinamibacterales bacterium]